MRVGFLGAGLIATYHSKSLRRSGAETRYRVERAGVFDPNIDRADAFAKASGHQVCGSEEEVLNSCDAVYICTWTSEHPRLLKKAAERGLAVFCEKPLAISLVEAEQMADAVRAARVTNQVGLILRHSPAYVWARQLVEDPAAGRVMAVVFRDDQFIPTQGHYASTWRADKTKAGAGTLLEHSIHDVDMLRFVVGDIVRVTANQANFHGHDGIEDLVTATVTFANGALGTLTTIWHDNLARPSMRRVEVFCERRHIVIEGHDWFGPVHWTDSDGTAKTLEGPVLEDAVAPFLDGPKNPDAAFIHAAVNGEMAWPDLDLAVQAHRVVEAMYASARAKGSPIELT